VSVAQTIFPKMGDYANVRSEERRGDARLAVTTPRGGGKKKQSPVLVFWTKSLSSVGKEEHNEQKLRKSPVDTFCLGERRGGSTSPKVAGKRNFGFLERKRKTTTCHWWGEESCGRRHHKSKRGEKNIQRSGGEKPKCGARIGRKA